MDLVSVAAPLICGLALLFLLTLLLVRYFLRPLRAGVLDFLAGELPPERRLNRQAGAGEVFCEIATLFFLSRTLLYLTGLAACAVNGNLDSYFSDPGALWIRWDANHYLGLADNWYVNEGDARLHLVFFPLYPLVLRALNFLTGFHTPLTGVLVSNVCLFFSGWTLYRLVEMEWGRAAGRRAARYLLFAPTALFFSIPYSESLFLLLTLLSVYFARRDRMGLAIFMGALAANTRVLGLLTAVPIYYEYLQKARRLGRGKPREIVRRALLSVLPVLLIATGFLLYLGLNWQVSGNPLQFLTYQSSHWSQEFGSLTNTLSYTLKNAISYHDAGLQTGTWIPQLLSIVLVLALLLSTYRKISPGDGAFALLYLYAAVAPTWLLSGPRYLGAMYALYPMLSLFTRRRWVDSIVMTLSVFSMIYMTWCYVALGTVL